MTACAVQFCPANMTTKAHRVWYCAQHRWPGGQDNEGVTVLVNGDDARFLDGVTYDVEFNGGRSIKGRFRGRFDLTGSNDSRLRFARDIGDWVALDPDLIDRVVAV
jgi:hypothetical protein